MDLSALSLGAVLTVLPFYIGLLTFRIPIFRRHTQPTVALALGASFFFFLDPIKGTNSLGAFSPVVGLEQAVLISAFALTFVVLAFGRGQAEGWPFWIVATGIAIHSFSESSGLAVAVPIYLSNFSVAAPGAASYLLHKFLEGFVLVAYCVGSGALKLRQVALAAVPMVVMSIAGALSSLLPSLDLTPFLASAAAGWMFVVVALGSQLGRKNRPLVVAMVAVGFVIVYSAGLLHSLQIG